MLRSFGYPLLFLAMFCVAGGHWLVFQSIAWTGMLIRYSQTSSIGLAIERTFSGRDPCKLCKAVEQGRKTESQSPTLAKTDKKVEHFVAASPLRYALPNAAHFSYPLPFHDLAALRTYRPPTPVPKIS